MKRTIILVLIGLGLLAAAFGVGRVVERFKAGYYYRVRESKIYDAPIGKIRWSYVTESVGIPLHDPGTTNLEFEGRTIYKAKRAFQASSPFARNINSTKDAISWDDGEYRFDLKIQRMNDGKQTVAPDRSLPPSQNSTPPIRGSEE